LKSRLEIFIELSFSHIGDVQFLYYFSGLEDNCTGVKFIISLKRNLNFMAISNSIILHLFHGQQTNDLAEKLYTDEMNFP
jgi:hypothetical protein